MISKMIHSFMIRCITLFVLTRTPRILTGNTYLGAWVSSESVHLSFDPKT